MYKGRGCLGRFLQFFGGKINCIVVEILFFVYFLRSFLVDLEIV